MKKENTVYRRKNKFYIILSLIFIMILVTIPTYAYWAGLLKGADTNVTDPEVEIGEGAEVKTKIDLGTHPSSADKVLVPEGRINHSKTPDAGKTLVDEIVLIYNVVWEEDGENGSHNGYTGTLKITISNIKIGGDATHAELVQIVPSFVSNIQLGGSATKVTLTITLIEPGTKEIYDAIINKTITFDITFEVEAD